MVIVAAPATRPWATKRVQKSSAGIVTEVMGVEGAASVEKLTFALGASENVVAAERRFEFQLGPYEQRTTSFVPPTLSELTGNPVSTKSSIPRPTEKSRFAEVYPAADAVSVSVPAEVPDMRNA